MITIVLRPKRLANGEYPIILKITKEGKSKIITLGVSCFKEHWNGFEISNKQNNSSILNRIILKQKAKALKIIDDFNLEEVDFTLSQFEERFRGKSLSKVTISEFWLELIIDLIKVGRTGNAKVHKDTYTSFFKFYGNRNIMFREMTSDLLDKYETHLRFTGSQDGGIAVRMREIRALFNNAIKKGVVEEKYYPFRKYKISKLKGKGIKRALTKEEFKKIESFSTNMRPDLVNAKYYFLFSYYTRGMNFTDMLKLKWENIHGDRIYYIRSKTKGRFTIKIMKPVKVILDYYKGQNRATPFVFPILLKEKLSPVQIENRKAKTLKQYNIKLKEMASILGIEKSISSYTARHSFATHLKYAGISTDVIGESLGHKDVNVTRAYLKEFEDDVLDRAMKKLLEEPEQVY